MKVDCRARRLWVAGGSTGLIFVYNIDTGSLIKKYTTPQTTSTFLNDIALAPNGDAYITDSYRPVLFKIAGSDSQPGELESWLDFTGTAVQYAPGALALNGIVVSTDGQYIVVVHTTDQKLYRVSVSDKTATNISVGSGLVPGDGMVLDGQVLYVVTRASMANAILVFQMSPDFSGGTLRDILFDPTFAFPTTIARAGNRMLVVNSQFDKRSDGNPVLPFTISEIAIPRVP